MVFSFCLHYTSYGKVNSITPDNVSVLNSFDRIAPVYDRFASLVFGSSIRDAQRIHLGTLNHARDILIIGGGTGWLLQNLLQANSTAAIAYVEASQRMIELARKRTPKADTHRVTFIHGTEETLLDIHQFDAIIINFYVDMFESEELIKIIGRLKAMLRPNGRLLCTDFVDDGFWQRMLLKLMYRFFRFTTGLRNQRLAAWRRIIPEEGFERLRSQGFWNGFMCSELYRKNS